MIRSGFVILSFMVLFLAACEKKNTHRYLSTEVCRNLTLSSNNLQEKDKVYVLYDTRLLLREKIDSLSAKHFNSTFCNRYRKEGTLRIIVTENKTTIIDTNLRVAKPKYGYQVNIDRAKAQLTLVADTADHKN